METEAAYCVIPQAFDGLATPEDTMDAEYQWLDAPAEITGYKYRKGTMQVEAIIIKVDYDFTLPELEVY
jgi:hypothetical protein